MWKRNLHAAKVFNRPVKILQRNRIAFNKDANQYDYLKDEIAERVVDRVLDIKRRFPKVLDLGSGGGHLSKFVDSDMMDELILLEESKNLLFRDADIQREGNYCKLKDSSIDTSSGFRRKFTFSR